MVVNEDGEYFLTSAGRSVQLQVKPEPVASRYAHYRGRRSYGHSNYRYRRY